MGIYTRPRHDGGVIKDKSRVEWKAGDKMVSTLKARTELNGKTGNLSF